VTQVDTNVILSSWHSMSNKDRMILATIVSKIVSNMESILKVSYSLKEYL